MVGPGLDGPILIGTFLLIVATLLPVLPARAWYIRDFDFPRLQLAVLGVLLVLVQGWRLAQGDATLLQSALLAATLGCLAWQAWWIAPYTRLFPREVRDAPATAAARLRILSANVLMDNRDAARLRALVVRWQPDILVTLETDQWWERELDALTGQLPHVLRQPLDNRYGMHVYSRLPLQDARIQFLVSDDIPSMHFAVTPAGSHTAVAVHCLHPTPPSPTENDDSGERDAELVMVGRAVAGLPEPVVVTGDLNDVAWSRTTRLFRKVSGLLDPRVGRGMFNTFHADWPILRWPLDHLFHSDHFTLVTMHRLDHIGSDHFPILVELALTPAAQPAAGLDADGEDEQAATATLAAQAVDPRAVHRPRCDLFQSIENRP